jgi:hypothetical protein
MKFGAALLLLALLVSPVAGQNAPTPSFIVKPPGTTVEDCVKGCKKCGSGKNPDCVRNFCGGLPHRKLGMPRVPIVYPGYS